jgi:hypothetical protein
VKSVFVAGAAATVLMLPHAGRADRAIDERRTETDGSTRST